MTQAAPMSAQPKERRLAFTYRVMRKEDEEAVVRNERIAFSMTDMEKRMWSAHCPLAIRRVVTDTAGQVMASLVRVPIALFVGPGGGGLSAVKTLAIAAVCVPPEARGCGVGQVLMQSMLKEAYDEGLALSMLFPTTWPFYRAVGYEPGGQRFRCKLQLAGLELRDSKHSLASTVRVSRFDRARDFDEMQACHAAYAQRYAGHFLRDEFNWSLIYATDDEFPVDAWVFRDRQTQRLEGFIFMKIYRLAPHLRMRLVIMDVAWSTQGAAHALVSFLRGFAPIAQYCELCGAAAHPLLQFMRDPEFETELDHLYALRVVNVRAALQQRAYPLGTLQWAVHITDPLLPANNGLYRVRTADGTLRQIDVSTSVPEPSVPQLSIGAFAALYSGFSSATELRLAGLLMGGDAAAVAQLDAAFAGATPVSADYF